MPPLPTVGGRATHWLPSFTGEEAEAQRGLATSLSSQSQNPLEARRPTVPQHLTLTQPLIGEIQALWQVLMGQS